MEGLAVAFFNFGGRFHKNFPPFMVGREEND
jgi:hypothetical protein